MKEKTQWITMSRTSLDLDGTDRQRGPMATSDQVALSDLGDSLCSLRLCSEAAGRAMQRSLAERGQLTPVLCYRAPASLELFDGFKRLRAARALGWPSLRVELIATDAAEAKLSLWQVNEGAGLSEIEEAWLLRALHRDDGLPQYEIARRLGRNKSWVSRRLMLAECLSDELEAQVRLGLVSATAARELGRLPRGNQDEAARAVLHRGLTTRQTAKLVESLLAVNDEEARRRLLADALHPVTPPRRTPLTPAEKLVADAQAIGSRSMRLHVLLLGRPLIHLGVEAAELAAQSLKELAPALVALCRTIDTVVSEKEVDDEYLE
jgi:ParB-like chromosome segregation protein Spo0J